MNETAFNRWLLHTSRDWDDIRDIVKKTYIPVIDQDHKQLARYALDLNLILEKIQKQQLTMDVLKKEKKTLKHFYEYTKEHFEREEAIINYFMLGNQEEQQIEHEQTLARISDVVSNIEKGKIIFTQDLKAELLEWIVDHTNNSDYETFNLHNLKFYFNKVSTLSQLKMFINYSGIPEVDEGVCEFIAEMVSILTQALQPKEKKERLFQALDTLWGGLEFVSEKYKISGNLKKLIPIDGFRREIEKNLEVEDKIQNGEVIASALMFISLYISEVFDLGRWFPEYLENCENEEKVLGLIKKIKIKDVDSSFIEILKKSFESFSLYKNEEKELSNKAVNELALMINQHFIQTERVAKNNEITLQNYQKENFKRLKLYLDKVFVHVLEDRLEYTINLRNKLIYHCFSQNNFHDYATFVDRPLDILKNKIQKDTAS